MAYSYSISDQSAVYFLTCTVVNWVDVFTRKDYADIVEDSLNFCIEKKGLIVYGYVIMSNHVHLIASAKQGYVLADIIRDLKKFSSRAITAAINDNIQESRKDWMIWMFKRAGEANSNNNTYQFWQQDNHPIELSTNEMMDQRLNYLHVNPVRSD